MDFRSFLKENLVFLDGAMGTLLHTFGIKAGELPENWNIEHPDIIEGIHKAYFDAGSNVVSANTFGANCLKFSDEQLEKIIKAAILNAKNAALKSSGTQDKFIALDIGPLGKLLKPIGDFDFENAVSTFAKTVALGTKYGADLIFIETMNDSLETKAAVLAAKENSTLPIIVSNAYNENGLLLNGASPECMVTMLEGLSVDAIGANCSLGPKQLEGVIKRLLECSSIPVIFKPNAGLPKVKDGKTYFDIDVNEFESEISKLIKCGVRAVGGCCGTTPEYIGALVKANKGVAPLPVTEKNITAVCSYSKRVVFGEKPVLIGERINPTGKKPFKLALKENDISYILNEGIRQKECGADILDVNVSLPEIDEKSMLKSAVFELQAVVDLPLQIDTSDVAAMEAALRSYNGKPMINSVNGKMQSMESIFPLVKKYGGVVVALTLDENGIPETTDGRIEIAKKILKCAEGYGISKKNIVFDTLALTISSDSNAANTTLSSLNYIKNNLSCHTSLGISNVSFGMPNRDAVNSVFFALALENGLSCAIMNPFSSEMMKTYYSYCALKGLDKNCAEYIANAESFKSETGEASKKIQDKISDVTTLKDAIVNGLKEKAAKITLELLKDTSALDILNNEIIPALDSVGIEFEKKMLFLPQLLQSAESAKCAFEVIKEQCKGESAQNKDVQIVIATVYGDIHDIGKNIVKLLLQNYGYNVLDLGKNVPSEKIVNTAIKYNAKIVGLSALMTTTVPAMQETIRQLKEKAPFCKIAVGGAVLTKEYAEKIGADRYCADAMQTLRFAKEIIKE